MYDVLIPIKLLKYEINFFIIFVLYGNFIQRKKINIICRVLIRAVVAMLRYAAGHFFGYFGAADEYFTKISPRRFTADNIQIGGIQCKKWRKN